jgi:hypothetical protein
MVVDPYINYAFIVGPIDIFYPEQRCCPIYLHSFLIYV